MKIQVEVHDKWFDVEVLPSDTVWVLKWIIYLNEDIRRHCDDHKWNIPSPDNQALKVHGWFLDKCENSLESYFIHEGTEIVCDDRQEHNIFPGVLDVLRKKTTELPILKQFTPFSWVKHVSMHVHELRYIRLENAFERYPIVALIRLLNSVQSLMKLGFIRKWDIEDDEWIQAIESFERNTSVKELSLSHCEIGVTCAIRIGQMLEMNHSLIVFDISYNRGIGDEGCTRIAEGLESNTTLKKLHFSGCGIGSKGAGRIGLLLEKNHHIARLDLCENEGIGEEGCIRIAKALGMNQTLKTLDLSGAISSSLFCFPLNVIS
eukprot:TRINITY_DN325_c0_g1_i8.p1 TRINITY_DN325_c0_g1~~TRINITY_DN325_c0_g1_i8.p1  ORF type:complete len:319 (+),score=49.03 TRINITY_DN325_c0_g1_i8:87-1043(+)